MAKRGFVGEVWGRFRPYAVHFTVDLLIFAVLWTILWVVHVFIGKMPVTGTAAELIVTAHEVLVACNYVLLGVLALYDIWSIKRQEREAEHGRSRKLKPVDVASRR